MVLLQIHSIGISIAELKRYAPWTVDRRAVAKRARSFQGMRVKPNTGNFADVCGAVQDRQPI